MVNSQRSTVGLVILVILVGLFGLTLNSQLST